MAWLYMRATRDGNRVNVRLHEPVREENFPMVLRKYAEETETDFVARGRREIAEMLAGLDAQAAAEVDVTNLFRPTAGGPGG